MATNHKKDRVYFQTLLKLGRYIEEHHKGEGFLPSESQMSELFGVSRMTFRAALAAFQQNGFIVSYPKKGHYVLPRTYWIKKVGIVLGAGKESPFLANGKIIASLISHLESQKINVQIIQSSLPENIKCRALAHGVRGLAWVLPDAGMLPMIHRDNQEIPFPQLVVSQGRYRFTKKVNQGISEIHPDGEDIAVSKTEFFLKRGHSRILFMDGKKDEEKIYRRVFREAGVRYDKSLFIENNADWEEDLKKMIEQRAFTAVVVSGGIQKREQILRMLNAISGDHLPEVFLPSDYLLAYFREKYPRTKVVASSFMDWDKLGEAAAEELAAHISSANPIKARTVKMHRIEKLS